MYGFVLGVDQYLSDQIMAQRGETMAEVRGWAGSADCFAEWRGAVGRMVACSDHGRKDDGLAPPMH